MDEEHTILRVVLIESLFTLLSVARLGRTLDKGVGSLAGWRTRLSCPQVASARVLGIGGSTGLMSYLWALEGLRFPAIARRWTPRDWAAGGAKKGERGWVDGVDIKAHRMDGRALVTQGWRQPMAISRNYIIQLVLVGFRGKRSVDGLRLV